MGEESKIYRPSELPKSVRPEPLKRGEVAKFRLLGIKKDPLSKSHTIPQSSAFTGLTEIQDDDGNIYKVGLVKKKTADGYDLDFVNFPRRTLGEITCRGDVIREKELAEFLRVHDFNATKENRTPGVRPVYEELIPGEKAKADRNLRELRFTAISTARELTEDRARSMALSLGGDYNGNIDEIRDLVERVAEENPQRFLSLSKERTQELYTVIKKAEAAGVISWDSKSQTWSWADSGEQILSVPRVKGSGKEKTFAHFLQTQDKGQQVLKELERNISAAAQKEEEPSENKASSTKKQTSKSAGK